MIYSGMISFYYYAYGMDYNSEIINLLLFALVCTILAPAGTSSVTQMLPPTVASFPMVIRPNMVALE